MAQTVVIFSLLDRFKKSNISKTHSSAVRKLQKFTLILFIRNSLPSWQWSQHVYKHSLYRADMNFTYWSGLNQAGATAALRDSKTSTGNVWSHWVRLKTPSRSCTTFSTEVIVRKRRKGAWLNFFPWFSAEY